MGSFFEYLAPLWAWQLQAHQRRGVVFGSVLHDPVRDHVVGPRWWHRRSVADAYSFLREVFVHGAIEVDTIGCGSEMRVTVIPHGPYYFPAPSESRWRTRERLGIPESAQVALSFGHIRDGKNLDLAIRAIAECPGIYLIVAGKEQSGGQKSVTYYRDLALSLKAADRCRWLHEYIPDKDVGNLFATSDVILLTYSRTFRSASGVLNAAVHYRRPCIASGGVGNLQSVVKQYRLGWFVEPDDVAVIRSALMSSVHSRLEPSWEEYESENSWDRNAAIVRDALFKSATP